MKRSTDHKENNEKEKYQFITEQIRPQKKQHVLQFIKRIGIVAVLAVVFGGVAGLALVAVASIFGVTDTMVARQRMEAGLMEEGSSEEAGLPATEKLTKEELEDYFTITQYKELNERIAAQGERCGSCIVAVAQSRDEDWFQSNEKTTQQCGVIFCETEECYFILTMTENLSESKKADVLFLGGERIEAKVKGRRDDLGIAVLAVDKEKLSDDTQKAVTIAEFGGESNLKLGTPVIALGCPDGVMYSVMWGNIINDSVAAGITDGQVNMYCTDIDSCEDGNGIIVNLKGKVIGITVENLTDVGSESSFSFLGLPELKDTIDDLVQGRKHAYLGIQGSDMQKGTLGDSEEQGIYITDVLPDSPAYEGEIRVADLLVGIDGHPVQTLQQLQRYLAGCRPGERITVTVKRKEEDMVSRKLKITLR